jgi:hypothetical protein
VGRLLRVNEGMGVNRPSVKTLRPDHGWGNSRHTQSCREKGKRGSVVEEKRKEGEHATGDRRRELEKLWNHRELLNIGEGE